MGLAVVATALLGLAAAGDTETFTIQINLSAATETATKGRSTAAPAGHGSASHALRQIKGATSFVMTVTSCSGGEVRAVKTLMTARLWIAGSAFRVA